jgi:putative two-component system response regulator
MDEILLGARIIAVADVIDAMTSARPYKRALGQDAALKEIEDNCGRLYDELVTEVCLNLFKIIKYTFFRNTVY